MRRMILPLTLFAFAACQPTTMELTEEQEAAIADTVRQLADAFFEDLKALEFDRATVPFSDQFVWAESGQVGADRDSLVAAWRGFIGSLSEVTAGEWIDVFIDVLGPDAAVFAASFDWAGVDTTGAEFETSGAWTTVWQRTADGWKVVQGHESYVMPEVP